MSKKNNIKVIQTARDTGDRLTPKEDLFLQMIHRMKKCT